MAVGKKSIIIYSDWIELFESLSDDEAGKLVKHFFRYVNDLNPIAPDRLTEISFVQIKQSLKRDLVKWEETRLKRSKGGKASAEKRNKIQHTSTKPTHVKSVQHTSTHSTDSVNVSVSVNDIKEIYTSSFWDIVETWLKYKKERKETYKSKSGLSLFCKTLYKISGGDEKKALAIIEKSMANNWAGIFDLKTEETKPKLNWKGEPV